jgi:membrane-associated phospholipid phosphatase
MQDPITYPPYGRMVSEWEKPIGAPGEGPAPPDWRSGVVWRDWREGMSDLLGETLWPRYDARNKAWRGAAQAWMHETTLADFSIFPDLLALMSKDEQLPDGTRIPQLKLFRLEDEADAKDDNGKIVLDRSIDASLRLYLAGQLTKDEIDELAGLYIPEGVGRKAGNVDLEIKRDMQRPRPYQIAFLLDRHDFAHRQAKSAVTPSMISGHCVEAMMAGMNLFYRLNAKSPRPGGAVLDALARHTIDVGDRRVFGGVHYPSDNLSSWLTGLLMCPRVFADANGGRWIWRAIQRHSRVYAAISEAAPLWEPYRRTLDLLDFIAGQKQPTIADAKLFVQKWGKPQLSLAS